MGRSALLTRDEEVGLVCRAQAGDRTAEEALVERNLGLVRKVVNETELWPGCGLDRDDLFQEGTCGLVLAARKFDLGRGTRFSTCAIWWIRQAVQRAVQKHSRAIYLPSGPFHGWRRLEPIRGCLEQCLGRGADVSELSSELQLSESLVRGIVATAALPLSLDAPMGNEGEQTLGDLLPASSRQMEESFLHLWSQELLALLDARERQVIELRFGLLDGVERTLAEVSAEVGVCRERVRQIEAGALRKLRGFLDLPADPEPSGRSHPTSRSAVRVGQSVDHCRQARTVVPAGRQG